MLSIKIQLLGNMAAKKSAPTFSIPLMALTVTCKSICCRAKAHLINLLFWYWVLPKY